MFVTGKGIFQLAAAGSSTVKEEGLFVKFHNMAAREETCDYSCKDDTESCV